MNTLDIIILVIVGAMFLSGYMRGFIKTLFDLISLVVTFGLTIYLYPYVSKFVMTKTGIYKKLSESVSKSFNLEKILEGTASKEAQFEAIKLLPIPENFKDVLSTNNNPEMFKLLDVSSFQDYISSTIASITVNVVVFLIIFIIISILLTVVVSMLNLVAKLPMLNGVNKLAGASLSTLIGVAYVFVGLAVLSVIVSTKNSVDLTNMIEQSKIGSFLYLNNPILDLLNNNITNNHFWKIIAR